VLALAAVVLSACSGGKNVSAASLANEARFATTTPAAKGDISSVTWDLFYEPTSLDPIHALDYTENEVLSNLCDSLVTLKPNFTYAPNLATYAHPNDTTWVYNIKPGVKFWDGRSLTGADVAYSLQRNMNPKLGSYYSDYFSNVRSITQTGPLQVTVRLKMPDVVFNEAMAIAAGAITEKAFDESKGKTLGSPSVGVMCSGPYKLVSWHPGQSLTIERNPSYWNPAVKPKVGKITFDFISTDSAQTNALTTGGVQGMYEAPVSGTSALQASGGHLYLGKSLTQFVITTLQHNPGRTSNPINNGLLRQALSLALDRTAIARTVFDGTATPPQSRTLFSEPVYPYAQGIFQASQNTLPSLAQNVARAKRLVVQAGSPKTPIVLAYVSDGPSYNIQLAQYIQSAAQRVGLKVKLDPLPTATFNNIGFDPSVDKNIDMLIQAWFNELPDPVQWYRLFTPGANGSLNVFNYGRYENAKVTKDIQQASAATNPTERAKLVVAAQQQLSTDLPWIPLVDMANRLYLGPNLTGPPASFVQMWYPWAAYLGSKS
jgi:peptide/nickel transport system substrate-binding protein